MHTLEKRLWRTALATIAATAALAATGCGDDDAGHDRIEARIQTVQDAFDARDLRAACRGMTERAQLLIAHMAHFVMPSCERSLRRVRGWMAGGDRSIIGPRPTIERVESDGRTATATVTQPGTPPYSVRMASTGERWKVDGVFDAGASTFQEASDVAPDRAPPDPAAADRGDPTEALAVDGGARTPCPAVRARSGRPIAGGCVVSITRARVDMSVLNLFGRMALARCDLHLTLHVAPDGRTWTDDFYVGGPKACGDIRACGSNRTNTQHQPWHGRIVRGGTGELRHSFADVCLDTCVGEYRGDWSTRLQPRGRGWRLLSDQEMVGSTGWLFDGTLDSRPSDLVLDAAPGP